jgi:hypothetical protein
MEEEIQLPYIKDPMTPKQEKGLTMVVKGISKRYPFITGYELIEDYKKWQGCLFLILTVDPFKMGEYLNCSLETWWDKSFRDNPQEYDGQSFYSLRSYLPDSCLDFDTASEIKKKMEESLKSMYEHLPEQYIKHYEHTSEALKGNIYKEIPFITGYQLDLSDIPSVDNFST